MLNAKHTAAKPRCAPFSESKSEQGLPIAYAGDEWVIARVVDDDGSIPPAALSEPLASGEGANPEQTPSCFSSNLRKSATSLVPAVGPVLEPRSKGMAVWVVVGALAGLSCVLGYTQLTGGMRALQNRVGAALEPEMTFALSGEDSAEHRLARDAALLDKVRVALREGDGTRALETLDELARLSPNSELARKAIALRVEALMTTGDCLTATAIARVQSRSNPEFLDVPLVNALAAGACPESESK
jgi:hypothetical protein